VVAEGGEMLTGEEIVAVVAALAPLPSVAVAVTLHDPVERGAVNTPDALILPQLAAQVTGTFAVNGWVLPSWTVGDRGAMDTGVAALTLMV
jgi:hypothetical protein